MAFVVVAKWRVRDGAPFAVLLEDGVIIAAFGPIGDGVEYNDTLIRWDQWGANTGAEIANNPDDYSDNRPYEYRYCRRF